MQSSIKLRRFEKFQNSTNVDKSMINHLEKLAKKPKNHSLNLNNNYSKVMSKISEVFMGNQKTLSKAEIDL